MFRLIPYLILASVVFLSACSALTPPFNKQAFGSGKDYAIVSIYADKDIEKEGDSETITGMFKALSGDAAYIHSAGDVLQESTPHVVNELSRSQYFNILPPSKVLRDQAYRDVAADPQAKLAEERHVAEGYKYLWDNTKLADLATKLNVDGVVTVHIQYGYKFWGTTYGKITSSGKTSPVVKMVLRFYDRQGQLVWLHTDKKYLREGVPATGDAADMKQLEPLLVKATKMTTESVVKSLSNRMQ